MRFVSKFIQHLSQGVIIEAGCLLRCTQIANIITSRQMNDEEAPKWNYDPFDADLKDETRQDAENRLEESFGADQITLPNPFFAMGAQFDDESTDCMSPVPASFNLHGHSIPEPDHMTYEDQTRQQFQTPGSFIQLSPEDRLTPETLASSYFRLGQQDPRHYFSSSTPCTSIEQSLSPASTPIAGTTPTSLPNTGPQSSLLSHTTSAATATSLDGSGVCPQCGYKVSAAAKLEDRNKNVRRHERERHGPPVKCPECGLTFPRPSNMKRHITIVHEGRSID